MTIKIDEMSIEIYQITVKTQWDDNKINEITISINEMTIKINDLTIRINEK